MILSVPRGTYLIKLYFSKMRKLLLAGLILISCHICYSQIRARSTMSRNFSQEVKVNLLYLNFGTIELSYELNQHKPNASLGLSLLYSTEIDDLNQAITAYYKKYVGKKTCHGFYFEGTAILVSDTFHDIEAGLALGFAIGSKFIRGNRWTAGVYVGVCRLVTTSELIGYPRMGVNIGYRL